MAVVLRASLVVVFVLFCHVLWCECGPLDKKQTKTITDEKEDAETDEKEPTQPPKVMPKVKSREGLNYKLKNDPKCKDDIADFCSKEANTGGNYDLLLCLQNQIKEDELSDECHQSLWVYKSKLVHDPKFESPATSLCQEDLKQLDECKTLRPGTGDIVPCLVENKDGITNARCRHVVSKLAQIMFSDYRLLKKFYKDCQDDVKKYECGRQDALEKDDLHTQGSTLECLEEHEVNLTTTCRLSVMRVAELQSKDYHLNRALYYACQDDRERLCATVEAGEGRVYTCLMKRKFDAAMSQECREKLTVKQKVESKDYKANFPFLDSCREAIREHKCLPDGSSPAQLAKVLLCLESAMNDGGKVGGKCRAHMKELQEELMEDYSINPAVVAKCEKEIRDHCGSVTKGGKTIDCLMEKAMEHEEPNSNIEFSRECFNAVSELLRETGAGGDFKVDATLRATCRLPAQHLCPKAKNDMSVLSCLMENLYHKDMGTDCQEQLMHLQFFLARDFQLDQALYSACKDDAKLVCGDPHMGNEDKDNSPQGLTLACLYRHILPNRNSNPKVRVSRPCVAEVMRTMHERAASVKLLPQIQMNCVKDLAEHCTNKLEPGEEIKCLQDNYDKLTEKCKGSIKEFTEEESEDIDLDKTLVKHCSEMAKMFCKVKLENNEADEILPCLYEHKYDRTMDRKCRAELEHRELIELKDYTFSAKFKQKCKQDVIKNCPDTKTKPDVIQCLSKHVRAGDVEERDHVISEGCRSQLKVEKLRQAEDIRLDPGLYAVCGDDAKKLCSNLHKEGPAVVLECLKAAERKLSAACKAALFLREKEEVEEPVLDVRLFKVCKAMIKKFCMNVSPEKVLGCLKQHKRELDMDEQCKAAVFVRQKNALKDIQLSPDLEKACKKDVPKFCHDIRNNNEVIPCLKRNIGKLSEDCEEYVAELEEEAALDYRLNPALAKACENEIEQHCSDKQPGHGEIMECLKDNFKQIKNGECRKEIKEALIEERTDIMADPVLHEACYSMVTKYCDGVSHGRGRILQCLLQVLGDGKIRQKGCKNVLKSRRDMWSSMQIPAPESLTDLASIVGSSPRRNYFFIVFSCALAIIFIGGLISGRLTKRVARETKNR